MVSTAPLWWRPAGEGDPGGGPRGHRHPAEHRRRRRHRPHGAGRPAEDPQPQVPGTPGALRAGGAAGGAGTGGVTHVLTETDVRSRDCHEEAVGGVMMTKPRPLGPHRTPVCLATQSQAALSLAVRSLYFLTFYVLVLRV